jgi:hypothetical protein
MGVFPREHLGQGFPSRGVRAEPGAFSTVAARAGRRQDGEKVEERGKLPPARHARDRRWGHRDVLGWCVHESRRWRVNHAWHADSPRNKVSLFNAAGGKSRSLASQQTL